MTRDEVFVTRHHSGLEVSAIHRGYRVALMYIGYSEREAVDQFLEWYGGDE